MRNIVMGGIGTAWGLGILVYSFVDKKPSVGGAYGAGQLIGTIFGVLLFLVGAYYLIQGIRKVNQSEPKKQLKKKKKKQVD